MMARQNSSPARRAGARVGLAMATSLFCLTAGTANARIDGTGVWYDDSGRGAVHMQPCGNANQSMCGYIVWLKDPLKASGKPLTDALNPDPRNRNRPICGLQVIGQLKPQTDGSWDNGWIYDPKQGQSFDVAVRRLDEDKLQITGYLGAKFLGKTFVWRRAPQSLDLCNANRS
jgi:uncharacterized protein (DUF2147 family)